MHGTASTCLAVFVASVAVACGSNESTAPQGTPTIERLEFAWTEVRAGDPLFLVAHLQPGERDVTERVLLQVSSGNSRTVSLDPFAGCGPVADEAHFPWAGCSDEALTTLVDASAGRVFVGFKEALAERGVDGRGTVLTSDTTTDRMKEWLRGEGVTITSEYLQPAVAAVMEPDEDLVARVRNHPNIAYVEPIFPGERVSGASGVSEPLVDLVRREGLVSVIPTNGSGIRIAPGDSLIATYRQPDGSTIVARARVHH